MNKKLYTNELDSTFHYADIDYDFDIFKVSTSDNYISGGAYFLDIIDDGKVRSLVFEKGKSFYVLLKKGSVTKGELIKLLNSYDNGDSLSFVMYKSQDVPTYILLQLFLNGISNPEDDAVSFNNLSGKLMCYRPVWIDKDKDNFTWGLQCLEVKVNDDMCVHLIAHKMTALALKNKMKFEKRKLHDYPQYQFSYNNHTLKRVGKDELGDKHNFIIKPVDGERGNISFLDFSDYDNFSCTKNGVLYDVLSILKEEYRKYVQVKFKTYEIKQTLECKRKVLEEYKSIVAEKVADSGINFVDCVNSSTSEEYLNDVAEKISSLIPEAKIGIGKCLSKQKLNIRYIHEKQFYTGEDKHQDKMDGYVVQHITVENFSHKSDAAVYNILKELVIKKDLEERKLSITDWKQYNFQNDWIFGISHEEKYYFMKIHPDGSFDVEQMERNLLNMTEYDAYMDYFGDNKDTACDYRGVIGIIKDAEGNLNLIKDTNMYTVPALNDVGDILKKVADEKKISGEMLNQLLRGTMNASDNKKVQDELSIVLSKIVSDKEYSKDEVMKLLKGRNTKKAVVKYVYENTGVMLYTFLRGEEERNEYFSGTLDINYLQQSPEKAIYCVGEIGNGMKNTLERASVIREILAVSGSKLVFEHMLPLMGVEFVRYGLLTVVPFPFKYLREYIRLLG